MDPTARLEVGASASGSIISFRAIRLRRVFSDFEIGLGVLGAVVDLTVKEGTADRSSRMARERSCLGARRIFLDTTRVSLST